METLSKVKTLIGEHYAEPLQIKRSVLSVFEKTAMSLQIHLVKRTNVLMMQSWMKWLAEYVSDIYFLNRTPMNKLDYQFDITVKEAATWKCVFEESYKMALLKNFI